MPARPTHRPSQRRAGSTCKTLPPHPASISILLLMLMASLLAATVQGFLVRPRTPATGLPQSHHNLHRRSARGVFMSSTAQEPEEKKTDASEMADGGPQPVMQVTSNAVSTGGKGFGARPAAKTGTVNKRLMNVIDAELKVVRDNQPEEPTPLSEDDTDLNGINPIQPLGAAAFAGFLSFLFWRITLGVATALNNVHLETEFYPAKRAFGIASTAFVGITALGAGVIGVTALGLLGLTARVTYGIATGELDMNKKKVVEAKDPNAVPLDAKGLPKITGAWYDVRPPVPSSTSEEKK